MSLTDLLLVPALESLLALTLADALLLAAVAVVAIGGMTLAIVHVRRRPVYIPPTLSPPFWRGRLRYGVSVGAVLALVLAAFLSHLS